MKLILSFVLSFFAITASAAYGPLPQKSLTICGRTYYGADVDSLIHLEGHCDAAGNWATMRLANATTGYLIVGTLNVQCIRAIPTYVGNVTAPLALYGNTDVGMNSGAAPTTPIYIGGLTAGWVGTTITAVTGGSISTNESPISFDIPNGKYPAVQCNLGPATVTYYGVLR